MLIHRIDVPLPCYNGYCPDALPFRRRAFFFLIRVPCDVPKNTPKPAQNDAQRNTKTRTSATKSDNPRKGFDPVGITRTARIALTSNVVRALL